MSGVEKKKKLKKAVLIILSIFLLIIAIALSVFFTIYFSVSLDASAYETEVPSLKIYYDDGVESIDLSVMSKKYAVYEEISPYLIDAFVAVEDKRFFEHNGVDYRRLVGATVNNLKAGGIKEGGSTITQQLIKNTELDSRKTFTRKIKEMRLAHQLEKEFDKKEILEKYLNTIYFSNGIYGIANATERIFGKNPSEVSLSEAAILAGLVKNPQKYSPLNSIENAEARRNIVLKLMFEQEKIDEVSYDAAVSEKIVVSEVKPEESGELSYLNEVLRECSERLGVSEKELMKSDVSIYTYLDKELQIYANGILAASNLPSCNNGKAAEYATVFADNKSGGIKAVLNSSGTSLSEIRKQPGSAVKPFLSYLPAAEFCGYAPATPVSDIKRTFGSYEPENYKKIYKGEILLRDAVASSSNSVALELANEAGLDRCKKVAEDFGLTFDAADNTLPIVLGGMSRGTTFAEISQAYMTLANFGQTTIPHYIKSVKNDEKTLFSDNTETRQINSVSRESAYLVTEMLKNTVLNGTASKLSAVAGDVAAKTGTVGANGGNSNAVCAAYTPEYTVISSLYSVDNRTENLLSERVTGGTYPAEICAQLLRKTVLTPSFFDVPEDIVELELDSSALKEDRVLLIANEDIPETFRQREVFNSEYAPTEYSERGIIPDIADLNFSTENGNPHIRFSANNAIRYKIYRKFSDGGYLLLKEVADTDGIVDYEDTENTENGYVSYKIEAINVFGGVKEYNGGVIILFKNDLSLQPRFPQWLFR